ncbi:MAG: prolyl oligopeptidase family serine peptidase [Chloroflexota bacterium]|nr:MAG: phospholipase [Chloroflexota bacterium]
MNQQVVTSSHSTLGMRYLLHVPPSYRQDSDERWPLILYLHDATERGSNIDLVKTSGIASVVEEQRDLPFITVSPQCPEGSWWPLHLDAIDALMKEVRNLYQIDERRIYLTGYGMGGYGVWNMATTFPDRFAAIAPVSGGGDPEAVCALTDVPVWVFHGERDNVVLIREARKMVDALRMCGGKVRFTIYPNGGHDVWIRAYNNPRLYEWFLSHKKP